MNTPDYIEVTFEDITAEQSGVLVALLSDYGFEGFEETGKQLKAYISNTDFDKVTFGAIINIYQLSYNICNIATQNWNAVWEEQYKPVVVSDFVGIRAHFHPPFTNNVAHEIVITPKMSFGTGHHATTYMMIAQMQQLRFVDKCVLDFGTGTGILAILSEKLQAAQITAIDIDEWSIDNAKENIARNHCHAINLQQADGIVTGGWYDIILANINKNIILKNLQLLSTCLTDNGCLLISGLLSDDEVEIVAAANLLNLKHRNTVHKQQWIAVLFVR